MCAVPLKWTTVEFNAAQQRHVHHHVLLLALGHGPAPHQHRIAAGLLVSSPELNSVNGSKITEIFTKLLRLPTEISDFGVYYLLPTLLLNTLLADTVWT